ncbi:MAG: cryptochrome/photolyase family protein, partial [Flavobacteriaceae bacterium]
NALQSGHAVLPIFIFDDTILGKLPKKDRRLELIIHALGRVNDAMKRNRCNVRTYHGTPKAIFSQLIEQFDVAEVVVNKDYEPYARERDDEIAQMLHKKNIVFKAFKDQVIFQENEVVKDDGKPYVVYTPYARKWLAKWDFEGCSSVPSEKHLDTLLPGSTEMHSLEQLGFLPSGNDSPAYQFSDELIDTYEATRNFPALDQTSRLGPQLRFGTLSIRSLVRQAAKRPNPTFLKELIWREFFMQILWHFPHTFHKSFKPQYDRIPWRNNEDDFQRWCNGTTGYPLVDAGMRQLNATGFMHNRVRMLVGSFLCKHLLIDWRWGEAYFAEKLLDYEMSSNVGNWQWVAGSGVDAAPYFRIFNPTEQIKKFDKDLAYIQKWVPDHQELTYPQPIVEHKFARERCLTTYKTALAQT